ncbi:Spherulation-specific family 4-domain-containing protein [Aspergillus leporis]|uniref:Spherulation-specific family 4-domain-containing protein n=1 Tax=Aspergillus leporis TaxID=41062 RepID=A0A5N5X495_9EURO|nr:Spherulation-specific family 4-domain-containing protein [Aspergillus leporis]
MLFSNPVRALPSALCCLVLLSLHAQAATIPIRDCRLGIRDSYYWENTSEASPPVQQPTPTESTVRIPWKPSSTATPTALGTGSNRGSGKVEVMIPFYMYPGEGAWAPMEQLVTNNSNVKFTVIINPSSGPGSGSLPDDNWRKAIPKLAAHSNVLVIGYVSTSWGNRAISDVERDIKTYAEWPSASGDSSFAVHGIFLDEGPAEADRAKVQYYKQLVSLIKGSSGLGNQYVVMNPGTVPDTSYLDIPDSSVIFESPYSKFQEQIAAHAFDSIQNVDRARLATMVTSVTQGTDLSSLVSQLRSISGHIYLTNLDSYLEYCSSWDEVARLVAIN